MSTKLVDKQRILTTVNEMKQIILNCENSKPIPFINVKMRTLFNDVLKFTKDKTREENPMYKQIFKIHSNRYRLVTDYEKRVKNNLEKEGKDPQTFTVESPKGKVHISKSMLVDTETGTKTYLMIEFFEEIKGKTEYEFNGNSIEKVLFEKWISYKDNSNQKQGLDKNVFPITPNMDNILEISVNDVVYVLRH